jgi:hypothetical protein
MRSVQALLPIVDQRLPYVHLTGKPGRLIGVRGPAGYAGVTPRID